MVSIIVIGLTVLLEHYIKRHMDQAYTLQRRRTLAGGNIVLKKYYNTGVAGSFLSGHPKLARCIHMSALIAVFATLLRILPKKDAAAAKLGISLLAGGGFSNLYDRLAKGHVVDYVSFGFGPKRFQKLVFNLSDFFIFAGSLLCMAQIFRKGEGPWNQR